MKDSDRYVKVVEWSEAGTCYVKLPRRALGGCHSDDQKAVFDELCQIVDETVALYRQDGKELPVATAGKDLASLLRDVA